MKNLINTVPADHQMINSDVVSFVGDPRATLRILILGNSITRHAPSEAIDWHFDWGMAASAPEKDYVHRLHTILKESGKDTYMMIRQASHWERNFKDSEILLAYEKEKDFSADLIIFRMGENVDRKDFPEFKEAIKRLIAYVTPLGATVILTTSFWKNTDRDRALTEAAKELGYPCVDIGCTDEQMMAIGKFTHHGVSIHPGDEGMEMIASRLWETMKTMDI